MFPHAQYTIVFFFVWLTAGIIHLPFVRLAQVDLCLWIKKGGFYKKLCIPENSNPVLRSGFACLKPGIFLFVLSSAIVDEALFRKFALMFSSLLPE